MIKEELPTPIQSRVCFEVCQAMTNLYLSIYIVRLDERLGSIYVLAGEELQVLIDRNGRRQIL